MSNSAMPNLPGFGAIAENMELVRKMWGGTGSPGMGIPGVTAPALSVDEIDKQVADLKAVEAWLTLNMNILRGTIQSLELQSATLSALKSAGEAFKSAGKASASGAEPTTGFSFPFGSPMSTPTPTPQGSSNSSAQQSGAPQSAGPDMAAAPADPAAWWNMLQGQFTQAVAAATMATQADANGDGSDNRGSGDSAKANLAADTGASAVADTAPNPTVAKPEIAKHVEGVKEQSDFAAPARPLSKSASKPSVS